MWVINVIQKVDNRIEIKEIDGFATKEEAETACALMMEQVKTIHTIKIKMSVYKKTGNNDKSNIHYHYNMNDNFVPKIEPTIYPNPTYPNQPNITLYKYPNAPFNYREPMLNDRGCDCDL